MFGMFKNQPVPSGPMTFDFDILIDRPVSDVYPLVDWADPRNAKRQLGHQVEGESPTFVLTLSFMPEHRFNLTVTEEKKDEVYAFDCDIQPRVGRLEASSERYTFEPAGEGQCLLRLIVEATFIDGMTTRDLEEELMMVSVACNNTLAKLKIHAEHGLTAAQNAEHVTFT
jgi:hypothetical protein